MDKSLSAPLLFGIHPGELLKDFLEDYSLTQAAFARHIRVSPKVVNEIVNGKRGISPAMAFKLHKAFGTTIQFWMNVQNNYELSQVDFSDSEDILEVA